MFNFKAIALNERTDAQILNIASFFSSANHSAWAADTQYN